jgi:hypothetical protein
MKKNPIKVYTWLSKQPLPRKKKMSKEVLTQPDQTKSIRDLLDNHTRGIPLGVKTRQGEYFDTPIPRFDDLTDMLEYKAQLMDRNKELNKLIQTEKKEALEKLKKIPVDSHEIVQSKTEQKTTQKTEDL